MIHSIAFIFGSRQNSKSALVFVPVYFLLSYVLTIIEVYAMYASIKLIFQKKDVTWQSWNRRGIAAKLVAYND